MIERILGLDIGIASVGWAVVDHDSKDENNNKIIDAGVRIFTQAENPKTGESLALPRRLARGARRTLRRKRKRMRDIRLLFTKHLEIPYGRLFGDKETIYHDKGRKEVWQLRDEALKRKLTDDEFARVLTHIAKRRGYKSNRKSEEKKDSEGKKVLGAISENEKLLEGYETIGQAIFQTYKDGEKRRNSDGDYKFSVSRKMLEDEIIKVFEKQRFYKNDKATKEFENAYMEVFLKQLDFASVGHMVGRCTFEKKEKRAPKQSFSAEEFVTLTEIINNKMIDIEGKDVGFDEEQIETILRLCKLNKTVTFKKIRQVLKIDSSVLFKRVDYHDKNGEVLLPQEAEKQKLKNGFEKGFHALKKVIEAALSKKHWEQISQDRNLLNKIAIIFAYHKSDEKIQLELTTLLEEITYLSSEDKAIMITALIENISFDTFIHLSIKAVDKLNPHMKKGMTYDKACLAEKYENREGKKAKYLRPLNKDENNELTNPVVKRSLAQTRKVVNAIIARHGQFDKVHIELTREIKKSHADRRKVEKGQKEYREQKEHVVQKFIERYGREPKGSELLKFRLFEEQDGYCFYHDKRMEINKLLDMGYVEIDHILPFSRSLDDSMNNKILCFSKENQDKKNQTPYEYFTSIGRDWHRYEEIVKTAPRLSRGKRARLLKKNFDENSSNDFKERNKNDTSFMSKFIKNFIENNLELKHTGKQNVFTRNGSLTALLRHNWGVAQKNRENHYHHAQDAIVLAFATQSQVQKLSTVSAKHEGFIYENKEKKSEKVRFEPPFKDFRQAMDESIGKIFVSYAPRKKVTGAAHKETIYAKDDKKGSFPVNGGMAENGEVKRIDVFEKDGKFHFIYLYPADFEKKKLPNKTIKGKEIDESYLFKFSIFKDELLHIQNKNGKYFGYFKFALSDGRFVLYSHYTSECDRKDCRISTGSLVDIKKYHVTPLGEYHEIKQEKRVGTKRSR
jgi:CRISPR-associated endonuclease Csn1